jgi:hypothetical protein
MAIFSPTMFYFGQPVTAAAAAGATIRSDVYASSVTVAIPGTQFGSTFGQTDYRSDISGYINGGTSLTNAQMPLTGTGQVTSATTNFTGYTTSMSRPNGTNYGAITGTVANIDFGTGAFTIEGWMNPTSGTADSWMGFKYNAGWGFFGWSSAGYYRWVGQNAATNEGLRDFTSTLTNGTWVHIFIARSGSTWYGGVNGTIRANFTFTNSGGATGTSAAHQICGWSGATQRPTLFQDYRVTKGVARYTGTAGTSYTVPQSIVIP